MSDFRYVNAGGGEITFSLASGIWAKFTGVSENHITVGIAQGIAQVGGTAQSQAIQPREITADGIIFGDSTAGKALLLATIRPGELGKLYYGDYYLDVYPTMTPAIGQAKTFANFQFQLTAPYPYWVLDDSLTTYMSGLQAAFKFPWNLTETWEFATPLGGASVNVKNAGTAPAPFSFVLVASGTAENPKLTNAVTGKWLRLNRTMAAGETVTITTSHKRTTVVSTVDGDIRGDLDIDSTLRWLDVGDNVLALSVDSGASNLATRIVWSPELLGVAV